MIISVSFKNFYSLRDCSALDFTADMSERKTALNLPDNLVGFGGDHFVKLVGLFGSNAAGKSNIIKAMNFCRSLVLDSHMYNEGQKLNYTPFKFNGLTPSEFQIDFVADGIEYEYSFALQGNRVVEESLYHYPNTRKAKVFVRDKDNNYTFGKGLIHRPKDIVANIGPSTLFLSRASSMDREIPAIVYRFFLDSITVASHDDTVRSMTTDLLETNKPLILKAFEVSDSDIVDIKVEPGNEGSPNIRTFHREDPGIAFDFMKEESEGTKRLLCILAMLLGGPGHDRTIFFDEFDLRLHLRLAQFLLDVIRQTDGTQLVFTSHNPALIDGTRLRPEQIVLVNKDKEGNSEFVPLSDFEGISKFTDLEKAYRLGLLDGVPYIGDPKSLASTDRI